MNSIAGRATVFSISAVTISKLFSIAAFPQLTFGGHNGEFAIIDYFTPVVNILLAFIAANSLLYSLFLQAMQNKSLSL